MLSFTLVDHSEELLAGETLPDDPWGMEVDWSALEPTDHGTTLRAGQQSTWDGFNVVVTSFDQNQGHFMSPPDASIAGSDPVQSATTDESTWSSHATNSWPITTPESQPTSITPLSIVSEQDNTRTAKATTQQPIAEHPPAPALQKKSKTGAKRGRPRKKPPRLGRKTQTVADWGSRD